MIVRKRSLCCAALMLALVAMTFGLYGRTLGFEYVWDDYLLFLDKTDLLNKGLTWELLTRPVLVGTSYMRPLVFLSWYLEFHLVGQQPFLSHLVNIIILALNVTLIFSVVCLLGKRINGRVSLASAFLAATLYLVHPAIVESTAWVSGRFDQFSTLFILFAVVFFLLEFRVYALKVALICVCMMASLMSKELGFIVPVVLVCVWFAIRPRRVGESLAQWGRAFLVSNWTLMLSLLSTFAIYMLIRERAMGEVYHDPISADYLKTSLLVLHLPLEALKFYFQQSVLPFKSISPFHPISELSPNASLSLFWDFFVLLSVVAVVYLAVKRSSPSAWLVIACLAGLSPVLHIIPLTIGGNIGHERFMTAPLAFLCMAVVLIPYARLCEAAGVRFAKVRGAMLVLVLGWIAVSAVTVSGLLPFWSNELQLWNWAYHSHPDFKYARYNYIYGAMKKGRNDLAETEFEKIQKKYGGLDVGEQILYANLLIRSGREEGLKYLDGVMYALPRFHAVPNGRALIRRFSLTPIHVAGAYSDYANGLLVYKGDAEGALKYNDIAKWYVGGGEQIPLEFQRAAILYALGRFDEADALYAEQLSLTYYRKSEMKVAVVQLLTKFCERAKGADNTCSAIRAKGILPAS